MLGLLCTGARLALAIAMLVGAINMAVYYVAPELFPPFHPLMQLLVQTGYLLVPKLLELVGAVLLLTRHRALGLTLLWPVMVNILLFHTFVDHRQWYNGVVLLFLGALASWPERRAWWGILQPSAGSHRAHEHETRERSISRLPPSRA
jgi:hypothetical protein